MSQKALDVDIVLNTVLPLEVVKRVKDVRIDTPCFQTIAKFIDIVQFTKPPFDTLKQFHGSCFKSIAFSSRHTMTITHLVQLYISIYQHRSIWKECWTRVLPVMNAQLVRDVEVFREKYPTMDMENFIHVLKTLH